MINFYIVIFVMMIMNIIVRVIDNVEVYFNEFEVIIIIIIVLVMNYFEKFEIMGVKYEENVKSSVY